MAAAVRTGSVHFSTTILSRLAAWTMVRAVASQCWRSDAHPAPRPNCWVGVLTPTKMVSQARIAPSRSSLKKRFRPRHLRTTSSRPGS